MPKTTMADWDALHIKTYNYKRTECIICETSIGNRLVKIRLDNT